MATLDSAGNVYSSGPGLAGLLAAWAGIQQLIGSLLPAWLVRVRRAGQ